VDQTLEAYAATFETNVLGVLLCMKHELRVMQPQGAGSIVNISSTMGSRGAANASLYVASKHAVEGLTKCAALEAAAFGVRVNAIAPGPVETPMLDRFTGNADRKAGMAAACRCSVWASRKKLRKPSCSSRPTRPRSSRGRSSTSMAAKALRNEGASQRG